jgi:molybdopterin synthase catalytic subunit
MHDQVEILREALDANSVVASVGESAAGGIAVFLGTTRAEKSRDGRDLIALDYEAYEDMALQQMRDLAKRARVKWPIVKLAIAHRMGRVAVGEPSVIIAVSTPHRADSFEACKFLIDSLKSEATIWKKEVWADGTGTWIHPEEGARGKGRGARE